METKKRFAVILSGCGVYDGSEIHESIMILYAIIKNGGEYEIFAPDISQHHVINHLSGEEMNETRNVLVESARITRGKIKNLTDFRAADFDSLVLPGGYGAAKNLSDFAFSGADCTVNDQVARAIKDMADQGKPVGAVCIAPALIARILDKPELTIGKDLETAGALEAMGATHRETTHGEIVTDSRHRVVTSPCYMLDATILDIADGADAVIKELFRLF
jgi:enhancing lycopene biosynthesis protein 2